MEKASVIVMEDRESNRELVRHYIDQSDHTLVNEAGSLHDSLATVDDIANGELPCDVIILDGDLGSSSKVGSHEDGGFVAAKVRKLGLDVKIIGLSSSYPLSEDGIEVDADADKFKLGDLPAIIDNL